MADAGGDVTLFSGGGPAGGTSHERLSGADRAWLQMESPTNLMMITGVLELAELPSPSALARLIEDKLLAFRRFRQRVVRGPLGAASWRDDPTFDPAAHIHRVALPAPGGDAERAELVSDLMSTPLDVSRPLWQLHRVEDGRGGGMLVMRLHHCIADGFALMRVVLSLADVDGGSERSPSARTRPPTSATGVAVDLARLVALPPDPPSAIKGKLGVAKVAAWSAPIPLEPIKAAAHARGVTVSSRARCDHPPGQTGTHAPVTHSVPEGQAPHWRTDPHPSIAGPQTWPIALHVFGTHEGATPGPHRPGPPSPHRLHAGQSPHANSPPHPSAVGHVSPALVMPTKYPGVFALQRDACVQITHTTCTVRVFPARQRVAEAGRKTITLGERFS